MTADTQHDFIEVIHNAIPADVCAAIQARMRTSAQLRPGEVGSGVFPELKHSKDLRISGVDGWQDVDQQLQQAVFAGLQTYLRRYPQALIAPLMLQIQDSNGQPRSAATSSHIAPTASTVPGTA